MESSIYNDLVFKIKSLDKKLHKITGNTRDNYCSSDIYLTKNPQHYESIQNLLELAKDIKFELCYSLKYNPENRKTLKMYDRVCILEYELYNLVNCIEPFNSSNNGKLRGCGPKDTRSELREIPLRVSSDYSEVFPNSYYRQRTSFAPQPLKTQIYSDRYLENITEPEDNALRKNSKGSFGASSYYFSSRSSSSMETTDESWEPLHIRKSKGGYQIQPYTGRVTERRRTPERIPIYVKKSKGLPKKKKENKKVHKPNVKKSSLQLRIQKSDSNKINVRANDLQQEETEVFLIKKKRKSSEQREQSNENPSNVRYFISRLKRVMSSKSKPVDQRNKSSKIIKSSTPEHREKQFYIKKHDKKRLGISKYKENDSGLEDNSPRDSDASFYSEGKKRKKHFKKKFVSTEYVKSRRSRDSEPYVVARSSDLNNNPFYSENHIFYLGLRDSGFSLFPKQLSSKDSHFPQNHRNDKRFSKGNKETTSKIFNKPVKIQKHQKTSNISNISTDSNYEILGSYRNSNLYLIESDITSRTDKLKSLKSGYKHRPSSQTFEKLQGNVDEGRTHKYDSIDNSMKFSHNNSNMKNKHQNIEPFNGKLVLLRVVNDSKPLFQNKGSSTFSINDLNNKGTKVFSFSKKQSLNKEKSFDRNPFRVSTTTPSIYLATVPQALAKNTVQDSPLNSSTEHKVPSYDYIVNSALGNVQTKEWPNSVNVLNQIQSSPSYLKSKPSGKSIDYQNNKLHTGTLNKSSSKIIPVKTLSKVMNNSHAETEGLTEPLKNTKGISREFSKIIPVKTLSKVMNNPHAETEGLTEPLKNTKGMSRVLSSAGLQPISRNESQTNVSKSSGGSNKTLPKKKTMQGLARSLSKLNILSKRSKKQNAEKDIQNLTKEPSKNNLQDIGKEASYEKQPSSEKTSKMKSWSRLKRTMSGAGRLNKLGETNTIEKQADLKKVKSQNKLEKKPTLLKRLFSKGKLSQSKAQLSDDIEVEIGSTLFQGTTGYDGDKTSLSSPTPSILNHPPNTINGEQSESKKLYGYQVGSKLGKKVRSIKKDKKPLNNSKSALKDNPKAFNYSLHYSKEKHKCVEKDIDPRMFRLVDNRCPQTCGYKHLWSTGETVLSEHALSEFEKHNKYCEFFFKPNKCEGCTVFDMNVSKECRKRGERISLNRQPLLSRGCKNDNDKLYNDHINHSKSTPVTSNDHFISDGSDVCDWKKIADEIKECY